MSRPVAAGLVLGVLNAVVAAAALRVVAVATPDASGWFAYSPLEGTLARDPRFPWEYVVLPLALLVVNVLAVPWLVRRAGPHLEA